MANLLQSSQNKDTTAPSYYTNYLSNLATQGQAAAGQACYVGAQPLQTKAFGVVCQNFGAQQPGALAANTGGLLFGPGPAAGLQLSRRLGAARSQTAQCSVTLAVAGNRLGGVPSIHTRLLRGALFFSFS